MSSILRNIKRNKERKDISQLYGKKPKHACPKCGKLNLFAQKGKDIICVQCEEVVGKWNG